MEREIIEGIKSDLADAKKALREAERKANALGKIQKQDGRLQAENACYGFEMSMREAYGNLGVRHANGMADVFAHFPELAGEIMAFGGGR